MKKDKGFTLTEILVVIILLGVVATILNIIFGQDCLLQVDDSAKLIIGNEEQRTSDNNIKIISSTPSVELWFLLHFEYTTASMTNKDLISRLKEHYHNYDKNVDIYPDISDKTIEAIEKAKKLEKYQLDNGKEIGTVEANPNTEIYKIVEELLNK